MNTKAGPVVPPVPIPQKRVPATEGFAPKRTVGDAFRRLDKLADLITKVQDGCDEEITGLHREAMMSWNEVVDRVGECASAFEMECAGDAITDLTHVQHGIRADLNTQGG